MRLTEISFDNSPPVDGYGPGFFRIGGEIIKGGVLLLPNRVTPWAGFEDEAAIVAAGGEIDVLFIGTGAEISHIPQSLRDAVEGVEIGVELMASPTACRTYNVLLSEGRRIGAALLAV